MTSDRDGHVRVLPLHVANKIAAGEVVERPASVVKELVENALDAGATRIAVTVTQGGRKLVAVQDDGCGMTKDDALLSLERQATSKIRDVTDIEAIDTLGFRGEAIPSIASVSRFSITTRRADSDEGTFLQVNAGTLAEVRAAGCPPGTRVEVRDLFCNVPARRKFLRAYATEEAHVKTVFTTHALAHPGVGFSLTVDGRELYRLAPAPSVRERVRDLFGDDFLAEMLPLGGADATDAGGDASTVRVTGLIERPNLATPTRRDQYVFVNGRPATAASVAYALREAYPRRAGDARPATILFIELPPTQVDVNVHPTKRDVRFRDNVAVKRAIEAAVAAALGTAATPRETAAGATTAGATGETGGARETGETGEARARDEKTRDATPASRLSSPSSLFASSPSGPSSLSSPFPPPQAPLAPQVSQAPSFSPSAPLPAPAPVQGEIAFAVEPGSTRSRPWQWFRFLAQSTSGYLLIETDAGLVTINPQAARERITYERLLAAASATDAPPPAQALLIPETVKLGPVEAARIAASLETIARMGFQIEPFGTDTFKIDAVPPHLGALAPSAVLATIARDLAEGGSRRSGERWRDERIAKSVARAFAGASPKLTQEGAEALVKDLCACRMPYVCPRGKPVMIFTSTRELDRKFDRA